NTMSRINYPIELSKIDENQHMMVMNDSRKDEHQAVFFKTRIESESSDDNIKINIKGRRFI
ncbi:17917_t:CDS:1, partial [Cetraspora pellucida]